MAPAAPAAAEAAPSTQPLDAGVAVLMARLPWSLGAARRSVLATRCISVKKLVP